MTPMTHLLSFARSARKSRMPDMVSEQEAHKMVNLAGRLRQEVEEWICKNHQDLAEE